MKNTLVIDTLNHNSIIGEFASFSEAALFTIRKNKETFGKSRSNRFKIVEIGFFANAIPYHHEFIPV